MKKNFDDDLHLSLDPEETLRLENQILELKLKAEFGATTYLEGDITAEVENKFLKNVLEFENNCARSEETRICELLGNPTIKPELALDDRELESSFEVVNKLLLAHNITVDFGGSYDTRRKYKFITEELLEERIFAPGIPGMMLHFIYEEFHPDHKINLGNKAKNFIQAWFKQDADKILWELADRIILPYGFILTKEQIMQKLLMTFSCYSGFSDCKYVISEISFEINDNTAVALAEGAVSYNATINNKETIAIKGNFKLYFSLEYGWWDIFYFSFPGFNSP